MDELIRLRKENRELKKKLKEFTDNLLLKERFLNNILTYPSIIIECDEKLNLQYINDLGLTVFDVKRDEVLTKTVLDYIELKDQARLVEHSKAIFKGDFGVPKIYNAISSKGEQFDIIVSSAPVLTMDQSIRIRSTIIKCDKDDDHRKNTIFKSTSYDSDDIYTSINDTVKKDMDNIKSSEMVVQSPKMREIINFIEQIKDIPSSVLITGESGTGKELIARQIHERSTRKDKPFIAVNCGALPENLLESELFGYEVGAFTGANKKKKGKFEQAEGGILFLDEIGEMPLEMQVKLLRVLQDKVVTPIGSEKSRMVDTRVVLATNRDLSQMIKENEFREDLYYRIKVFQINLPSLKDRKDEIPYLCQFFISKFNNMFNKNVQCLNSSVVSFFEQYDFPGNIRELQHLMEYGMIFCKSDEIALEDLPSEYYEPEKELIEAIDEEDVTSHVLEISEDDLNEKDMIIATIIKAGGNKTLAASRMGMHKTTLYRKIKSYNISDDMLIGRV